MFISRLDNHRQSENCTKTIEIFLMLRTFSFFPISKNDSTSPIKCNKKSKRNFSFLHNLENIDLKIYYFHLKSSFFTQRSLLLKNKLRSNFLINISVQETSIPYCIKGNKQENITIHKQVTIETYFHLSMKFVINQNLSFLSLNKLKNSMFRYGSKNQIIGNRKFKSIFNFLGIL